MGRRLIRRVRIDVKYRLIDQVRRDLIKLKDIEEKEEERVKVQEEEEGEKREEEEGVGEAEVKRGKEAEEKGKEGVGEEGEQGEKREKGKEGEEFLVSSTTYSSTTILSKVPWVYLTLSKIEALETN